jgi:hypothetical protein
MANKWPGLDIDKLEKGQVLSVDMLEKLLNLKREDARYSLTLMMLVSQIKSERTDLYPRVHHGTIIIQEDEQALAYNRYRLCRIQSSAITAARDLARVDPTEFDSEKKREYETLQQAQGFVSMQARKALNQVSLMELAEGSDIKND